MKLKCCFVVLVAVILNGSFGGAGYSQCTRAESKGQIKGVITDSRDVRVAKASILIEGNDVRREIASDESGNFSVAVPIGTYRLTVRHPTFRTYVIKDLKVSESGARILKIKLKVKTPVTNGGKCVQTRPCS